MKAFLVLLVVVFFGCSGDEEHIKKWMDDACACKDATCAKTATENFEKLRKKLGENPTGDAKKAKEYVAQGVKCINEASAAK